MHAYCHSRHIYYFRLSAIFLIAMIISVITTLYFEVAALISMKWHEVEETLRYLAASFVFAVLYRTTAASARCPLCTNLPLLSQNCQKHVKAERFFGSYPLMVACSLLLRNHFHCPYCGDSSECRVKPHHVSPAPDNDREQH